MKTKRNQRQLNFTIISAMLLGISSLSVNAYATLSTSDMAVTASINASCTMNVTDLDFGAYDPVVANATSGLTGSATVSATCTLGATGVVTMTGGLHSTFCMSSKCDRRMANAGETSFLRYNIYTNASYSWGYVWTDNPVDVKTVGHVTGSGISQDLTVYGEVHKNQTNASAGSYTDTINVTIRF
ncbi:spore coat U domain-containing protein [Oceanospirillaceae bacterium]|nr:spore coat U domain-containing protein [Oceanospirillaceae bacterium]